MILINQSLLIAETRVFQDLRGGTNKKHPVQYLCSGGDP